MWTTCIYLNVHNHDIPKFPKTPSVDESHWLEVLKYFVEKGLIFRAVSLSGQFWLPGLIEQNGTKWVWKMKSIEELKSQGIKLTCRLRHDFDQNAQTLLYRNYLHSKSQTRTSRR